MAAINSMADFDRARKAKLAAMRKADQSARTSDQRMHDRLNEGGEGFGSQVEPLHDNTPRYKGDDQSE